MEFQKGILFHLVGLSKVTLFLLCVEGLSALLQKSNLVGRLKGLQTSRLGPWVSHLFFANDSLFFGKASLAESREFMEILKLYEDSSG